MVNLCSKKPEIFSVALNIVYLMTCITVSIYTNNVITVKQISEI